MVEKGSIIVDVIPRRLGPWGWPNAAGISGRMSLERVAECHWNEWPNGDGIRTMHLAGRAADVAVEGIPSAVLAKLAARFEAGGVGVYPTFVHVDTGPVRAWTG